MPRGGTRKENLEAHPVLFELDARAPAGVTFKKQNSGFLGGFFGPKEQPVEAAPEEDNQFNFRSNSKLDKNEREAALDHANASKKKIKVKSHQEAERIVNSRTQRISVSKIENEQIPFFGDPPLMVMTEAQILHDVAQMAVMDEKDSSVLQSIDQMIYTLSRREKGEIKRAIALARKAQNQEEYYRILAKNCPATIKYFKEMKSDKRKTKIVKEMEKHGSYLFESPQQIPSPNFDRIAGIVQPAVHTLIADERVMKVPIFVERKFLIWSRRSKRVVTITADFINLEGINIDIKTSDPTKISELNKKIQTYNRVRLSKTAAGGGHILWDDKWGVEEDERTMVSVANANLEDVTVYPGAHQVLIYAYDGEDNGKFANVELTEEEILLMGTELYKAIKKLAKKK